MYDKVSLLYCRTSKIPDISRYLDSAIEQTDIKTGDTSIFGYLNGLKVSIRFGEISIIGSLAKFYFQNNIYPLDRKTTALAIERLSSLLGLDMDRAKVTSIEFGATFIMKRPINNYLARLGNMPRLQRYAFNSGSLYFKPRGRQQAKVFAFYDKLLDAKAKGMVLPSGCENANLLKYEMRLNKGLAQRLRESNVNASMLSDRKFYKKLIELYQDSYFSITKLNPIQTEQMNEIKTVSDALNVLITRLIHQSGHAQIAQYIEELKANNVFSDRKNYTRLKKKIEQIYAKGGVTASDELIRELDNEIKNVGAYF